MHMPFPHFGYLNDEMSIASTCMTVECISRFDMFVYVTALSVCWNSGLDTAFAEET